MRHEHLDMEHKAQYNQPVYYSLTFAVLSAILLICTYLLAVHPLARATNDIRFKYKLKFLQR